MANSLAGLRQRTTAQGRDCDIIDVAYHQSHECHFCRHSVLSGGVFTQTHNLYTGTPSNRSCQEERIFMVFQVGDKVIHKRYGLGEVIKLDNKELAGKPTNCYVVRIRDLTMWVPADDSPRSSLRMPTPQADFENLCAILCSPGEPLSIDRFERKNQLYEMIKDGSLEGFCRVIRDLTLLGTTKKLNVDDRSIMERALSFLINEWMLSFSVSQEQAVNDINHWLGV